MDLIKNNPYRIAGILSNATIKDIEKQKGKFKAYTKVGKEIKSDIDFELLGTIVRTQDSIAQAFSNLEHAQNKVDYALFWFSDISPSDKTAIEYLKNGNEEKALDIWERITTDKSVNSKNYSAFNNISTYKLLNNQNGTIKSGIEAKIKLIQSDYFENFVHSVSDETISVDNQKQSETLIDKLLGSLNGEFSSSEIQRFFDGCSSSIQKYVAKKSTEVPYNSIENEIEQCKLKRKKDKGNAFECGMKLYSNTQMHLSITRTFLGKNDVKYKTIADELASEIMQCGIDYFNERQKNDSDSNVLEDSQKLIKLSESIAVSKLIKDRAKENLSALEEMEDDEISSAITLLDSIKSAYEENKAKIESEVQARPLRFNERIDWGKVNQIIEESIDWDKVVDLVLETIPFSNIEKISKTEDKNKLEKYKSLVNFLLKRLGYSQTKKIKYLAYWKTEDRISNSLVIFNSLSTRQKTLIVALPILLLCYIIIGEKTHLLTLFIVLFLFSSLSN